MENQYDKPKKDYKLIASALREYYRSEKEECETNDIWPKVTIVNPEVITEEFLARVSSDFSDVHDRWVKELQEKHGDKWLEVYNERCKIGDQAEKEWREKYAHKLMKFERIKESLK